jgi:radical SAM protein with 4Fe4S-binding SPASM domain
VLNKVEKKIKRIHLKSLPINVMIEPTNSCNLNCVGCITGTKPKEAIQPQVLKFEQFKKYFDQVKDYVFNISLFNWGEPFLNKDIFFIIQYASSNKCGVTVHSNLNIFNEIMAENSITAKLTHIYVAIDGATQETYEKYRRGGNLSQVFRNIEVLVDKKRKKNSLFPILTWQYLAFPHNVHEIEDARIRSKQLKMDAFEVFRGNLDNIGTFGFERTYDLKRKDTTTSVKKYCDSLWDTLIIYPDGSVIPCCQAFREKDIFGNVNETSVRNVWNNTNYMEMRKAVKRKKWTNNIRYPCRECKILKKV